MVNSLFAFPISSFARCFSVFGKSRFYEKCYLLQIYNIPTYNKLQIKLSDKTKREPRIQNHHHTIIQIIEIVRADSEIYIRLIII